MARSLLFRLGLVIVTAAASIAVLTVAAFRWRYGPVERDMHRTVTQYVARVVNKVCGEGGLESLRLIQDAGRVGENFAFHWWVVDRQGTVLFQAQDRPLPQGVGPTIASDKTTVTERLFDHWIQAVPLENPPGAFLVVEREGSMMGPGRSFIRALILFTLLTTIGTIAVTVFSIVFYLRLRGSEARRVLTEIQSGRLSARFPLHPEDGPGGIVSQFNSMAGEIERLVLAVKRNEHLKKDLLAELGHDLRTPLASIQNLLEVLHDHDERLSSIERREHLNVCLAEFAYIKKLLEDLLFVSKMNEARYKANAVPVKLGELVALEIDQLKRSGGGEKLIWNMNETCSGAEVLGDNNLLQRMIRNVLQNARRFARNRVEIGLTGDERSGVELVVRDDGSGFTAEGLENFGNRLKARDLPSLFSGEVSTGLGSVIVQTIARLHGASVTVANWSDGTGKKKGAEVRIAFRAAA
ncbi:MAG: HAMP domain-containing histidine kinase [Deltaproteobacteria bacterium]|nr:HAMP domain-containing histidine kinase [Deltaproteobacteria bacterium]MBI3293462.1 HAMP domain-containing histidine kinase [Deltaproteobacteria bacterium]